MSQINAQEKCIICLEKYKFMIPLHECLSECGALSVAQVLQNLNFLSISDAENHHRSLCFICVAKVQSCFEFKILCNQTENSLQTTDNSSSVPYFLPITQIKREENWEESSNDDKLYIDEFHKNDQPLKHEETKEVLVTPEGGTPIEIATSPNKFEIKIEEGIFTSTQDKFPPQESADIFKKKTLKEKNNICSICQKGFKTKQHLREHFVIHTGERPYACNVCNKSFRQSSSLTTHKLIHTGEKPYVCDVCNKSFNQSSILFKHKLIHTGKKPHVCNICNKSFTQSSSLNAHKVIHTGERPYVCDICFKSYNHPSALYNHKFLHTGKKPYVCNDCNKSFPHSNQLVSHRLHIHTEKAYVCDVCNKSFVQASGLAAHKLIHTGEAKPHMCNVCNKSFNHASSLWRHKSSHINMNMFNHVELNQPHK